MKTQTERNKLGQFATPTVLATDILRYAAALVPASQRIRFLDPAFGTGSFYSALLRSFPLSQIAEARGYEVDGHYGEEAKSLWAGTPLELSILDFTRASSPTTDEDRANLLICNPPYVRHHHLSVEQKQRLQKLARRVTGVRLSGLAGLYTYFLLISHEWMVEGGLAGWLIPSEFMDVNYGKQLKLYLLQNVTLLHIHRFSPDEVQFGDALVSSAVVWFKKEEPPAGHQIKFSYGGTLARPEHLGLVPTSALRQAAKWTRFPKMPDSKLPVSTPGASSNRHRLSDFFTIKRGLATGANKFFILTPEQISEHGLPDEFLVPILPSPRYLVSDEIEADDEGNPVVSPQLFLLACSLPESIVRTRYPSLWRYLQVGVLRGIDKRYLCRHRSPWYSQEARSASPLLCTYMGRRISEDRKPFRFILNHSRATASNVYLLLYPKPPLAQELEGDPELLRAVWQAVSKIPSSVLIGEGRVYGGGLYKIEPNELANAPADDILAILPSLLRVVKPQLSLFDCTEQFQIA
jgi:adenine-specific DNA-methyltransferase